MIPKILYLHDAKSSRKITNRRRVIKDAPVLSDSPEIPSVHGLVLVF